MIRTGKAIPTNYTGCVERTRTWDSKHDVAHGDAKAIVISTTYAQYENGRFIGGCVGLPTRIVVGA